MYKNIADLECSLREGLVKVSDVVNMCRALRAPFRAHPLGFISSTFLSEGSWNARLHIWPLSEDKVQDRSTQIHDHVFDFTSWVLFGVVQNTELSISEIGNPFALYSASYAGSKSILKKTDGVVRLVSRNVTLHPAGRVYSVKAGQLHETRRIGSSPAVTVLITNTVSPCAPSVVGPINGPDMYEYDRVVVSDADVDAILGCL